MEIDGVVQNCVRIDEGEAEPVALIGRIMAPWLHEGLRGSRLKPWRIERRKRTQGRINNHFLRSVNTGSGEPALLAHAVSQSDRIDRRSEVPVARVEVGV